MRMMAMIVLAGLFCGTVSAGENLVVNGGFAKEGKKGVPEGWRKGWAKVQGTLSLDSNVKKSAPASLKVVNTAKDQYTFYRQTIKVDPNTEYVFSCWMKGENIKCDGNGGAMFWILKNGGKSFRDGSYLGLWKPAKGTFEWSKVMISFKTKNETEFTIMVGLSNNSTGTVWFDDVILEKR